MGEHGGGLHTFHGLESNSLEPITHCLGGQEWTPVKLRPSINFIISIPVHTEAVVVAT